MNLYVMVSSDLVKGVLTFSYKGYKNDNTYLVVTRPSNTFLEGGISSNERIPVKSFRLNDPLSYLTESFQLYYYRRC